MGIRKKVAGLMDARTMPARNPWDGIGALDITVLSGGPGGEREVSLQSGAAVVEALRRLGHRVTVRDVAPDNLSALDVPADFIFIALHGEFGEDGALQAELERRKLTFNGSGSAASRTAMDKEATKRVALREGIPTAAFCVVDARDADRAAREIGVPAMVKPPASGSSVDTHLVLQVEFLASTVRAVAEKYGKALVETYIRGRELSVGILGDEALPPCEIRTRRPFYNYEAKYVDTDTEYLFEIDLPPSLLADVQALSLRMHRAVGCEVISRVDWLVESGSLKPHLLEINTLPGFTSHSLVPKAAARTGISFEELCERIIDLSIERASDRLES